MTSPDPHFGTKLASCTSTAEIDAMREGILADRGMTDHERHQFTCMRQHIVSMELEAKRSNSRR